MDIGAGCECFNYYKNIRLCHYIPDGGQGNEKGMKRATPGFKVEFKTLYKCNLWKNTYPHGLLPHL